MTDMQYYNFDEYSNLAISALYAAVQARPEYFESSMVRIDWDSIPHYMQVMRDIYDTHAYTSFEITLVSKNLSKLASQFPKCRTLFTNSRRDGKRITENEAQQETCIICHKPNPPRWFVHYCI